MEYERLIEVERQNDALLRRAHEEAGAIRQGALDAAHTREAALAQEIAQAIAEGERALAARRSAGLSEIAERAHIAAARYVAVSDAAIATVAGTLASQLVHNEASR